MSAVKRKLMHKGIVFLACLFALELLFLGVLLGLLQQAEIDIAREAHGKEVINRTNLLIKAYYDASLGLFMFASSRDLAISDNYDKAIDQVVQQVNMLENMVVGQADGLDAVKNLRDSSNRGISLLEETKRGIESGRYNSDSSQMRLQTALVLRELMPQLEKFQERQRIATNELVKRKAASRQQVVSWLLAGLVANLLMGATACILFFKDITRRLNILVDNSLKLKEEKPLNELVGGADEIAHLDRVFHDMAKALDEATRLERAILANSVDVICSLDENDRFTFVSHSSLDRWGYENTALVGRQVQELLLPERVSVFEEEIRKIRFGKHTGEFETTMSANDGDLVATLWSVSWSDEIKSLFCVVHDISGAKELEKAKQQFIAMVGHDLRSPLTSVMGLLYTLQTGMYGQLSERGLEALHASEKTGERMINLINHILDAEKLKSGTFELCPEDLPLEPIIRGAVETVSFSAKEMNIQIEHPYTDLDVFADDERLEQVLVNLLSNALKFSPTGTCITVSAEASGGFVEVSVRDQGPGIASQYQTSIFKPFRQVSGSDQRNHKGVGLGLPICKKLIEMSGGSIGVESETGKGARFWLKVPKGSCEDPEATNDGKVETDSNE